MVPQQQRCEVQSQRSSRRLWSYMAGWAAALCLMAALYSTTMGAATSKDSGRTSSGGSCTQPRPADDALQPFCFIPTVSKEAQAVLEERRVQPVRPLRDQPLSVVTKFQADYDARTAPVSEAAAKQHLQGVTSDTIAGVRVHIATPKNYSSSSSSGKLLVYLHGGAYVKGSCDKLWQVTALTARLAGLRVMCVGYRLAPQHPFPAGLDDAVAVYRALLSSHGYRASSIGIMGDSAGGGLALALMQRLLQEGVALPGALALMAPWCDLRRHGDTLTTLTGIDPVLQYDLNLAGSALDYVGGNADRLSDPLVSPLLAEYGRGHDAPPTLIQVGLRDSLLSSAVLLYRKMVAGGLKDVVLSPWEGMWHVFQAALQVPEAQQAAKEMAGFFKQHLK